MSSFWLLRYDKFGIYFRFTGNGKRETGSNPKFVFTFET
jgi:hypothetical protein